jgi:Ohr subfamily peroxiredoxin
MDGLYTARARATGDGRQGEAYSEDGVLDLDLRVPQELGGPGGGTNPEQLFAAGYAACFHSAFRLLAAQEKLDAGGSEVEAGVTLGMLVTGGYGLGVELTVRAPRMDREAAEAVVAKAHEVCPYSNATRGNVAVVLRVA